MIIENTFFDRSDIIYFLRRNYAQKFSSANSVQFTPAAYNYARPWLVADPSRLRSCVNDHSWPLPARHFDDFLMI